jgi:hypothetical protein
LQRSRSFKGCSTADDDDDDDVAIIRQFVFKKKLDLIENFETGESAAKLVTDVEYKLYVT